MELKVLNTKGEQTGKSVKLNEAVFNTKPNDHAIYLDVKQHLANRRQGTHASLEKSMVNGSTRKLRKQKGTGGARLGSRKSPLIKGGARAFGPQPRDYGFKLNRKLKRQARLSALSYKTQDNQIIILEDFNMEAPKTKSFLDILTALKVQDSKTLLVLPEANNNIVLSARNLPKAKVKRVSDLNTYDILYAKQLILIESSVSEIEKAFAN